MTTVPTNQASPNTVAPMTIVSTGSLKCPRSCATDNARGAPGTYLWFVEEVGELAHAIANRERGKLDQANLEEEFADVMAWLATLANICGVDMTKAIHDKYIQDGGPEGFKV
ncbi:MAG: MazG nucleotide pyrophosphohydrolase domain-containing protein [Phycisphaerales bacterium]